MGRRKTTSEPPRRAGMTARAVDVMWAIQAHADGRYQDAYQKIAWAFLKIPANSDRHADRPRLMGEFDHVSSIDALLWIARVRERDLLASVLLTDALAMLARYVVALGDDRGYSFPTPQCKKDLTMAQGRYFIEFEVPEGAAFRYHHEEEAEFGPGFRGLAFVERCHLSSAVYQTCDGIGVIPGFGRCQPLLGFDIPCELYRHATAEGGRAVCEPGKEPIRVGVEIPFGFATGWRPCDHWGERLGPLAPKLGLDEMVKLITEAAGEPAKAPDGADED